MPKICRKPGMDQNSGYKAQAMPELEAKIRIAPRTSKRTTSGINHHFFSWRANSKNSLKLILDTQRGTASMVFLAADQQTVFKTVPCLIGGAIDFNFDYGFLIGSSIVFHVDPGPPPYQKFWNYTVSNSVSGLRIDGLVGTATAGCADTPTQFSHTDVLALYIPTPKLN